MKFHALVELMDCVEVTVTNSNTGAVSKKIWLVVRDILTDRTHQIEDRSGTTYNALLMESYSESVLVVRGIAEPLKRINFLVLEKWGVWDAEGRKSLHPETREDGFEELLQMSAQEASEYLGEGDIPLHPEKEDPVISDEAFEKFKEAVGTFTHNIAMDSEPNSGYSHKPTDQNIAWKAPQHK